VDYFSTEYTLQFEFDPFGEESFLTLLSAVTLLGGSLIMAGIAYPGFAKSSGWPVGAAANGPVWALWFGMGALAYLAGMHTLWHWWGLIAAVPVAFLGGMTLTLVLKKQVQLLAYLGPILANVWFLMR